MKATQTCGQLWITDGWQKNRASASGQEKHFLEHMAAQLKVLNVEIILGAILTTAWEEAAAEKCHFTYAANESTIK